MSSPTHQPCTPKRPTAPRYSYYTTPSPQEYRQRSKPRIPSSSLSGETPVSITQPRRAGKNDIMLFTDPRAHTTPRENDPLKSLLRQKFRARCLERAAKAREEQVKRRRHSADPALSEASSDGFEDVMDDDVEEDDDAVMQDELFRRIVESSSRKERHAFRVSYALEVGSSFDPDMEDVGKWEEELRVFPAPSTSPSEILTSEDLPPSPSEQAVEDEVAVYAEELAVLAEFQDIPEEELLSWSDFEDEEERSPSSTQGDLTHCEDDSMCIN